MIIRKFFSTALLIASAVLLIVYVNDQFLVSNNVLYKKHIEMNDYRIYTQSTSNCSDNPRTIHVDKLYEVNTTCGNLQYVVKYSGKSGSLDSFIRNSTIPNYIVDAIVDYNIELKSINIHLPDSFLQLERASTNKSGFESELSSFLYYYNDLLESEELLDIDVWHNIMFNVGGTYDLFISIKQQSKDVVLAKAGYTITVQNQLENMEFNGYTIKPKANIFIFDTYEFDKITHEKVLKEEICKYNQLDSELCESITVDSHMIDFDNAGFYEVLITLNDEEKTVVVEILK